MIAWQSRDKLAVLLDRQHTGKSVGKVGPARIISPVPTNARGDKLPSSAASFVGLESRPSACQGCSKCYLSNFGSFFPLHNFSSNRPRAACRGDKHHPPSDEPCRITFPRLYCPFSWSRYRTRKTETGTFLLHNFSFLAVHGAS